MMTRTLILALSLTVAAVPAAALVYDKIIHIIDPCFRAVRRSADRHIDYIMYFRIFQQFDTDILSYIRRKASK